MGKKSIFVLSVTAIIIASGFLCFWVFKESGEPKIIGRLPNCAKTVTAFFDNLSEGNFKKAEKYLAGNASLDFDKELAGRSEQKLFEAIRSSYAYTLIDQPDINGTTAVQKVRFVCFSANEAKADLAAFNDQFYHEVVAEIKDNKEVYDANGNLKEEVAMEIFDRSLDKVIAKKERYYCKNELDIQLVFEGGKWKIVLDEPLISALLGGL